MGGGQGKGSQGAGGHVDAMPGQPLSPSGANHVSFPWPLPPLPLLTPWGPAHSSQTLCPARGKWEDSVPPPQLLRTIKLRTAIS